MEAKTSDSKHSGSHTSSEVPPEGVKDDVILEEVEEEEAAAKEDEAMVEEAKEEVILEEGKGEEAILEEKQEEEVKLDEVVGEKAEEIEKAAESETAEEGEKVEETKHEVSISDGTDTAGPKPSKEEPAKEARATISSRIAFRRQVTSESSFKSAGSGNEAPAVSSSHPSFKSRFSASVGSGHRVRAIKVYSANSGAAITSGSRRTLSGKVTSFSSGHQMRSSGTSSKGRDVFSSQSNQQVKTEHDGHGVRKDSGAIMGGDWRKVISKRRGATCSVEVIWKLKQSEMSIERRREEREFCTGSTFVGHVDAVGMEGECTYTMPHGVVYEGAMHDGTFDCLSTLTYPNKGKVDGAFLHGKLTPSTYTFPDGLVYELADWTYCTSETPDRRFQQEIKYGLKPVCTSLKTQQQPTRTIPEGCYDTGDGFYNPKTRCVTSPFTGNIIRIPTKSEANWIAKNCRKAWDEPSGYRPGFNENFRNDDVNYAPLLMESRRRKSMEHRRKSSEAQL